MVRRRDYTSGPVRARRLWILVCALALAVGLGACGQEADPSSAENDGVYVDAGPITYQLQISRQLNQYAVEDRQYLAGLPQGQGTLTPDQLWYGVFLWAKNQTNESHATSDSFTISDTNGDTFHPIHAGRRAQRVRVDPAGPRAHRGRARAEHDRELRPDPGWD